MNDQNSEFIESAPTDMKVEYVNDKPSEASSRLKAGLLITSGFVIFGALVGGGAFAMTGSIPSVLAPVTAEVSTAPSATDNIMVGTAGSEANKIMAPNFELTDVKAEEGQAVDPVAGPDASSSNAPDSSTAPAATDPSPASSSSGGTQIIVPPQFSGGDEGDDEGDNESNDD